MRRILELARTGLCAGLVALPLISHAWMPAPADPRWGNAAPLAPAVPGPSWPARPWGAAPAPLPPPTAGVPAGWNDPRFRPMAPPPGVRALPPRRDFSGGWPAAAPPRPWGAPEPRDTVPGPAWPAPVSGPRSAAPAGWWGPLPATEANGRLSPGHDPRFRPAAPTAGAVSAPPWGAPAPQMAAAPYPAGVPAGWYDPRFRPMGPPPGGMVAPRPPQGAAWPGVPGARPWGAPGPQMAAAPYPAGVPAGWYDPRFRPMGPPPGGMVAPRPPQGAAWPGVPAARPWGAPGPQMAAALYPAGVPAGWNDPRFRPMGPPPGGMVAPRPPQGAAWPGVLAAPPWSAPGPQMGAVPPRLGEGGGPVVSVPHRRAVPAPERFRRPAPPGTWRGPQREGATAPSPHLLPGMMPPWIAALPPAVFPPLPPSPPSAPGRGGGPAFAPPAPRFAWPPAVAYRERPGPSAVAAPSDEGEESAALPTDRERPPNLPEGEGVASDGGYGGSGQSGAPAMGYQWPEAGRSGRYWRFSAPRE